MQLIYINKVGDDWQGSSIYEFLFTDKLDGVDGDGWDSYPASGNPSPPNAECVKKVGRLSTTLSFDLVQYSDTFAVWDSVDGVVALGWENISDYEEYPDKRLYFSYGDDIKLIDDVLYERDLVLQYNKVNKSIKNEN